MKQFGRTDRGKDLFGNLVIYLVAAIFFYLYAWFVIKPELIYHSFGRMTEFPMFYFNTDFFQKLAMHPGGAIQYPSNLLSQLFFYRWAGALLIAATAFAMGWCFKKAVQLVADRSISILFFFLPAGCVLATFSQYDHVLNVYLAILLALVLANLWWKVDFNNAVARAVVYLAITGLLYYVIGRVYIVFAVSAISKEFFHYRRVSSAIAYLFFMVAVLWFVGVWACGCEVQKIYGFDSDLFFIHLLPRYIKTTGTTRTVLLVLLMACILINTIPAFRKYIPAQTRDDGHGKPKGSPFQVFLDRAAKLRFVGYAVFVILLSWGLYHAQNPGKKRTLEIDYYVYHHQWGNVLRTARNTPLKLYTPFINHNVNKALFYEGRLSDEMFGYPQHKVALLLISENPLNKSLLLTSQIEIFLELGEIGGAERHCYEQMENSGESAWVLKNLATINQVKGHPEIAKVYLNVLARQLTHRSYARDELKKLRESNPELPDERLRKIKARALSQDHINTGFAQERLLLRLLAENKNNRMAFEYLMAHYLLTRQTDKIAAHIHRLDDFGIKQVPKHYEEALVLYMGPKNQRTEFDPKWRPDSHAFRRAHEFFQARNQYRHNEKAGPKALATPFGDSYFYYYTFGVPSWEQ